MTGVWPHAARRRTPGATSALSSTSFQFFHVGNTVATRLPAALRPSAGLLDPTGIVDQLYSMALTISSASGKAAALTHGSARTPVRLLGPVPLQPGVPSSV